MNGNETKRNLSAIPLALGVVFLVFGLFIAVNYAFRMNIDSDSQMFLLYDLGFIVFGAVVELSGLGLIIFGRAVR